MESTGKDDEKSLIDTFVSITSASRDEALFFLESHNFSLEPAIHSFYEDSTAAIAEPQHPHLHHPDIHDNDNDNVGDDDDDEDYFPEEEDEQVPAMPQIPLAPPAVSSRGDRRKKKAAAGSGRIRTLADLNRQGGDGSDSDEDGPQEYYTGGEKSGMLVQDPNKGGHVDAILNQARQMGAVQGPYEHQPSSSSRSFTGTGRLLSGESVPGAPRPPESIVHDVYLWRNGFSIGDGPLRRFDDPANASFLESIKKSECPKELEPEGRRSVVHLNLVRKEENYPEPVKRKHHTLFHGVGRTLGGGSCTEPLLAAASPSAATSVTVDDSRPTTSIQLRLADGSRTVARFNTDHTIGDIRAFINNHTASGRASPTSYGLQTVGFPPKQLMDTNQTIEQAGLANSVVIQKL